MDKRTFLKSLGLAATSIPSLSFGKEDFFETIENQKKLLASILQKGDTIGLIAPAGVIDTEESIVLTKEIFETFGFKVKEGKHIRSRYGNLAGKDEERLSDLHSMFADKEVKAIICIRGGAGASRLLPQIDYKLISQNPKVLLGYSDITALIMALFKKTGLISFHGAVGISTWSNTVAKSFENQFLLNNPVVFANPTDKGDNFIQYKERITTLKSGQAEGTLLGGNLTLISGLCGSDYLPDFTNAILFLEEVDENIERVDRMFCQLKLAGILDQIKGFIFGKCTDCGPTAGYGSLTLEQVLNEYIRPLEIPAYSGAMIGHIANQFILPVGAKVRMDADKGTITLLDKVLKD
ncbi:LD-carboxypeptidase [Sphingobacterium sp. SRCM116780]|uniref:S66 peptidase family protein n=1 Tax=Sphingobacterium sp. SRCM116780 TaxID=2907623 RepID=UPI001F28B604|nr:LD-carboxypeptidase [Sphingobacterium sp. SRCM116780]UIR56574.1 LD-carboxypeptidase [Sphingobacterium sp. SRCM116780]